MVTTTGLSPRTFLTELKSELRGFWSKGAQHMGAFAKGPCIVCAGCACDPYREFEGVDYFECRSCGSLFADRERFEATTPGSRAYDSDYWSFEVASSRERSYGSSLLRLSEALLYLRRPAQRLLDVSTGPGQILDAVSQLNPALAERLIGVEPFPPPEAHRTKHPNYQIGFVSDLQGTFDGGLCVEVIEHLWPDTLRALIADLAKVSNDQALYLFNSAQPSFVKNVYPEYMSPHRLGHVVSYSIAAVRSVFAESGFEVHALPGRDWAFLAEFKGAPLTGEDLMTRVWTPLAENVALMKSGPFGHLLHAMGIESARCYLEAAQSEHLAAELARHNRSSR